MDNDINFTKPPSFINHLTLKEVINVDIYRGHRGYYLQEPDEKLDPIDLIVNLGLIHIAKRITGGDTVASKMNYMAIGSGSTAASATQSLLLSEQKRKALAVFSATANNVVTAIATFGGAADVVTSVQIAEAGIFNHANSGNGEMYQRVTFAAVTLADSDILKITMETNVGSVTI